MTLRDKAISLRRIWPVGLIAAMVVGVIYGGIATATEAGAIGAVATALVAFSQRTLDRRGLMQCANETVVTTATLLLIGIGATLLAQFLALSGVPRFLSGALQDVTTNHVAVILICCLIYLVMGAFLDTIGIMLLTLPILIPIFRELGINEIWAGVILVKMLEIGLLTPPLGMNVFVMNRVSGDSIKLGTIFRGVSWFLLVEIVVMALLIFIPAIILFLPSMMIG